MATLTERKPLTLGELKASGWQSRSVKQELHDNLLKKLSGKEQLFSGIIGYDDTVIPEITLAILCQHDILIMGEKGQAKSRLMRGLVNFLDEEIPYIAGTQLHDDPLNPITREGRLLLEAEGDACPIAWWPREDRYAERLAPGTKFADLIGEIDPAKLATGTSMSAEEALHFGLILPALVASTCFRLGAAGRIPQVWPRKRPSLAHGQSNPRASSCQPPSRFVLWRPQGRAGPSSS